MIIPVFSADAPVKCRTIPIVVSRTNVSPLSHAAIRDPNLVKDLQPFATWYSLDLCETFLTDILLHFLLFCQTTFGPKGAAATRVKTAIKILETAWVMNIGDWS